MARSSQSETTAPMKWASKQLDAAWTRKMSSARTGLNACPLRYGFCAATLSVLAKSSPVVAWVGCRRVFRPEHAMFKWLQAVR